MKGTKRPLGSLPTYYGGVEMRSDLEAKTAFLLDSLDIEWKYEDKPFKMPSGSLYLPDFYLPKINLFIEVRPEITEADRKQMNTFAQKNKKDIILVSPLEQQWFGYDLPRGKDDPDYVTSTWDRFWGGENGDPEIYIGVCSHCKTTFLCPNMGSYHCGHCRKHEGDNDLIGGTLSDYLNENIEKAKRAIKELKSRK